MKKIILCDLDDTLIETQRAYDEVTNEVINLIMSKMPMLFSVKFIIK